MARSKSRDDGVEQLGLLVCLALGLTAGCEARSGPASAQQPTAVSVAAATSRAEPRAAALLAVEEEPSPPRPAAAARSEVRASRCNEQPAQPFLIAAHFDSHYALGPAHRQEWPSILAAAVRYRTERYGYVRGYGKSAWNDRSPWQQRRTVRFFGVPVIVHERIADALGCVESEIRARCADRYQPAALSGMRRHNPYPNGEISNHVYGIAIDIDPTLNPCCGCAGAWRNNARCREGSSKFERMALPRCWVEQFERFGFHWLGDDHIEDTMHFEFLGDPERITR